MRQAEDSMVDSKNSKPVRVAIYARVSTTSHRQDVGLQLDELRQVASQRGWQVMDFGAHENRACPARENRAPLS